MFIFEGLTEVKQKSIRTSSLLFPGLTPFARENRRCRSTKIWVPGRNRVFLEDSSVLVIFACAPFPVRKTLAFDAAFDVFAFSGAGLRDAAPGGSKRRSFQRSARLRKT